MNSESQRHGASLMQTAAALPLPLKVSAGFVTLLILSIIATLEGAPRFRALTLLLAIVSVGFLLVRTHGIFDLMHPVRVFGSLWCFCLSLATMRLLPMNSDWNLRMWACVLTGLVSFIVGFGIAGWLWGNGGEAPGFASTEIRFQGISVPIGKTLALAAACIAVGTAVLAYEYHLIGGVPILAEDIDVMRMELFGIAGQGNPAFNTLFIKIIHFFVEFTKYGVFFAFIAIVQHKNKSWKVVLAGVLLILTGTVAYGSQAGRTFVIDIAITCAVLFHYIRRNIRFTQLCAAVLIIFIFLGIAGSLRTQTGEAGSLIDRVRSGSGFPEGQFWDGVGFGYLTLTESFEVFYRLTSDLQSTTRPHDGFLFYGLHRLLPRANIQEYTFNLYTGAFVTPTYLGEFYADYGIGGIFFGSLALGLFYGWVYSQGAGNNALYWVYFRGMLIQILFFFPYVNLFSQQITWIQDLFFMYFLIRLIYQEKPGPVDVPANCEALGESPA